VVLDHLGGREAYLEPSALLVVAAMADEELRTTREKLSLRH
jgi:hypothetical protein